MARMTTNRETHEYLTFAPSDQTCPACKRVIGPLEPVRRGMLQRQSGPPAVVYRHVKCRKQRMS